MAVARESIRSIEANFLDYPVSPTMPEFRYGSSPTWRALVSISIETGPRIGVEKGL